MFSSAELNWRSFCSFWSSGVRSSRLSVACRLASPPWVAPMTSMLPRPAFCSATTLSVIWLSVDWLLKSTVPLKPFRTLSFMSWTSFAGCP